MSSPRSTSYIEYLFTQLIKRGEVDVDDTDCPLFKEVLTQRNIPIKWQPHKTEYSQNQRRTYIISKRFIL